jgi:hypothetical protein
MEGPLGIYEAALRVPLDAAEGAVELEVVASDAAGNVSRRTVPLRVGGNAPPVRTAYASAGGAAVFAAVLLAALGLAIALRRRRRPGRPLDRVLLARTVKRAGER